MKNFLKSILGLPGLVIYYIIAVIIRIPVALLLIATFVFLIVLWNPITRRDDDIRWINHLYDWYCGK